MQGDVQDWRHHCLQCLKLIDGTVVLRARGVQLVPERVGEVILMDYIYIGRSYGRDCSMGQQVLFA